MVVVEDGDGRVCAKPLGLTAAAAVGWEMVRNAISVCVCVCGCVYVCVFWCVDRRCTFIITREFSSLT